MTKEEAASRASAREAVAANDAARRRDARHGGATLPREASEGAVGERTGRAVDVWSPGDEDTCAVIET